MRTIKLSVTHRGNLLKKYGPDGFARIQKAIESWIQKDQDRGITTLHLNIDDRAALEPYGLEPVGGRVTPNKVKAVIDALFRKLSPDYLVLLGSGEIVPFFEVPNPSYDPLNGDGDPVVPTDNPYACSRLFVRSRRESYLISDRVLGRIPDLPGGSNPAWLTDYLSAAEGWSLGTKAEYSEDLFVCCDAWKGSGHLCVESLSRESGRLLISPPAIHSTAGLLRRRKARLHMIKCHGAPLASAFYGQKEKDYPEVLTGSALTAKTVRGTVVGAMCCYGAALFDPDDPAAVRPGEAPIPSVYLRQGAWGFAGSTTVAWVGSETMLCADWVVSSFLRGVLQGASLGRALLEAKQDLVRWINQQGRAPDLAEEKTLLQFLLLGDPAIHALPESLPAAVAAAQLGGASGVRVASPLGAPEERRARRAFRHTLGESLRAGLPERVPSEHRADPTVKALEPHLGRLMRQNGLQGGFELALDRPLIQEVHRPLIQPELSPRPARGLAPAGLARAAERVVSCDTIEYYWMARREAPVPDLRLVKVETDLEGSVLRTEVLVSS